MNTNNMTFSPLARSFHCKNSSFFLLATCARITHRPKLRVNVKILERFSRLLKSVAMATRITSNTTIAPRFTEIARFNVTYANLIE
jgi:hypothetical protein